MNMMDTPLIVPNARVKPTCVAEPTTWQAFSAMLLVERSKFGLNELLGLSADLGKEARGR